MAEQEIWTFQDAVEHLLDAFDVNRTARAYRHARRGVLSAMRRLVSYHDWPYYHRTHVIKTEAAQTTGTVIYDHTEGTYERQLTLTGATWPSWAVYGNIKIGNVDYRVATRESDTVITLDPSANPGADVASTTYTLFRQRYPLPLDFRSKTEAFNLNNHYPLDAVSPGQSYAERQYLYNAPNESWQTTIVDDPDYLGALAIEFSPAPLTALDYGFVYKREPRRMAIEKYATGTVGITFDSTQVDGTSTAFTSSMVGSIIRISSDADEPTSEVGSPDSDTLHLPAHTRTIMEVANATTLVVDTPISETDTGRGYTISDPIDVHYGTMLDAFLRLCEAEYARLSRRKDASQLFAEFRQELNLAMDAARHDRSMQSANIGSERWYTKLGTVDVDP